jgi:hypothetical protein
MQISDGGFVKASATRLNGILHQLLANDYLRKI